jgi:very-short-patch-repair endonuclease
MRELDFARQLRAQQTDTENLLWSRLRAYRLCDLKFRRQQPIGILIVELDGGQHQERADYDKERDGWFRAEGYTVLRYWNNEAMGNLDGVLEDIARVAGVFAEASPSPQPLSPQGRGARNALQDEDDNTDNPQSGLSPLPLEGGGAGGEGEAAP